MRRSRSDCIPLNRAFHPTSYRGAPDGLEKRDRPLPGTRWCPRGRAMRSLSPIECRRPFKSTQWHMAHSKEKRSFSKLAKIRNKYERTNDRVGRRGRKGNNDGSGVKPNWQAIFYSISWPRDLPWQDWFKFAKLRLLGATPLLHRKDRVKRIWANPATQSELSATSLDEKLPFAVEKSILFFRMQCLWKWRLWRCLWRTLRNILQCELGNVANRDWKKPIRSKNVDESWQRRKWLNILHQVQNRIVKVMETCRLLYHLNCHRRCRNVRNPPQVAQSRSPWATSSRSYAVHTHIFI